VGVRLAVGGGVTVVTVSGGSDERGGAGGALSRGAVAPRGAVPAVDDHDRGDHREHEDDSGDRGHRTPAPVGGRVLTAVVVVVVDRVIWVVLDIAIQVIHGADGADVIDVSGAKNRRAGRVRSRFANGAR
jgi:hypothetical protein